MRVVVAEEIILDLRSDSLSRYGTGLWTVEQIEETSECFAGFLTARFPGVDMQELLETTWNGSSPLRRVNREVSDADRALGLVRCIGSPQRFISIYTGGWVPPKFHECLADGLTVDQRTQSLIALNDGFGDYWIPALERCGWISSFEELPTIEQVRELVVQQIGTSMLGRGAWSAELHNTHPECVANFLFAGLSDDQKRTLRETAFSGASPYNTLVTGWTFENFLVNWVECVGDSEDFISVYADGIAPPELHDCLATGLTIDERVELFLDLSLIHI